MLEKITALIERFQSKERFVERIGLLFPYGSNDVNRINRAYDATMRDFIDIKRDGGTPYFGHPEAVHIIVREYLRFRDVNTSIAAILHDNVEDLAHLGWTHERITREYGQSVSELVWWVSKPPVEQYDGDKDTRDSAYHELLKRAPRPAIMIKLADRLHNIMTLWVHDEVKQRRKILETLNFYLPLAEEHTILIHELEAAISNIEKGWKG